MPQHSVNADLNTDRMVGKKEVSLILTDTDNNEENRKKKYKDASVFIICVAIDNPNALSEVENYVSEIKSES